MRTAPALALAAVTAAAVLPAHAAVLQTAPVYVYPAGEMVVDPGRELPFDASLGELNGVILNFDGTVGVRVEAYIIDPPPYPTEVTLGLIMSYGNSANTWLGPFTAPITVTDVGLPYQKATASMSVRQSFDLEIPSETYGRGGVYLNFSWFDPQVFVGPDSTTGAYFFGSVSATFDYTPAAVSEPASLGLLGIGLTGLVVRRRGRSWRFRRDHVPKFTAASLAALALSASPVRAAVVSYTAPAYTLGDNSTPNALPGFDPILGALTAATVSFTGTISGSAGSDVAQERPTAIDVSPYLVVSLLGGQVNTNPSTFTVAPTYLADGSYSAFFLKPVVLGPHDFQVPAGANGEPLHYTIAGGFDISPNPAEKFDNSAPFSGTATVTYEYVPVARNVPEPTSLALLGTGLALSAPLAAPRGAARRRSDGARRRTA